MSNQEDPREKQLEQDIALLDRLLGVEARKPGKAASLPAAIRIIETLEPAGGKQVPVFPASYAGAKDQSPPVYDLAGVEYDDGKDTVRVKNGTAEIPRIRRAKMCALDSPQSQANRMEPAFLECDDLRQLVPQASAIVPRREAVNDSVLSLPHRAADFRIRLSNRGPEVSRAINAFNSGDCLPLLRLLPTSLLFGFWNSRGEEEQGVKHARILLSRIDAHDVIPCRRHSLYSGPYSKDEFAEVVLQREMTREEGNRLSKEGFSAAPSDSLGGVLVNNSIERLSLLSLTDIARIRCNTPPSLDNTTATPAPSAEELTNAARRYLFALGALAEGHERSKGSHRLRSGCELVTAETIENGQRKRIALQFEFRGAQPDNGDAASLQSLYFARPRLIAVARASMNVLGVQPTTDDFTVTPETLSGLFTTERATAPAAGRGRGRGRGRTATAAAPTPEGNANDDQQS